LGFASNAATKADTIKAEAASPKRPPDDTAALFVAWLVDAAAALSLAFTLALDFELVLLLFPLWLPPELLLVLLSVESPFELLPLLFVEAVAAASAASSTAFVAVAAFSQNLRGEVSSLSVSWQEL
jgi:hypothetical protein